MRSWVCLSRGLKAAVHAAPAISAEADDDVEDGDDFEDGDDEAADEPNFNRADGVAPVRLLRLRDVVLAAVVRGAWWSTASWWWTAA